MGITRDFSFTLEKFGVKNVFRIFRIDTPKF